MKFFTLSITLLVWGGMFVWMYAQAATTANVSATVAVSSLSVTVSDGSIAYGTLATSGTNDTLALSDTQTVTNTGNDNGAINVKGTLTSDPDLWNLAPTAASEKYRHRFSTNAPTLWTALSDAYQTLVISLAANGTSPLDLEMQVPTTTTATSTQTTTVTVQVTTP